MTAGTAAATSPADVQKPKRAQSAYFLFANEMREQVTKEIKEKGEGKFKLGDVAKEVGVRWAALSAEAKKPYEEKAEADKQRYAEELRVYLEASDPAGTLRKKYAHLMPKRALTAAARYQQDAAVRAKAEEQLKEAGQEAGAKQVDAKVKEMWKAAGEEERKPFEEQATKEKAEFFQKQKEWQATAEFKEIEAAEKLQEERAKAAEAEEKAKAEKESAKTPAKRAKKGEKAAETPTPKSTPAKRKPAEEAKKEAAPSSAAKRTRTAAKDGAEPGMFLDADIVAEAAKLELEGALRNLAGRPEVAGSGKKPSDLLAALKASGGLVNPAKRALLGQS
mmetsp:Transcript_124617/g.357933  ORF Transcript_124617/g.357933 Transcript_124617/m.357933 type:complete len:335 (-) Transcript_124617:87-1091(-)